MGGGVACYVHRSLQVKILATSNYVCDNSPEYLLIEVRLPDGESVLFASIYRRPKGLLLHDFVESLNRFSHLYKNIIIGGDLNCNLSSTNFEADYLRELMSGLSLHIVNSEPTHHTAISDSWLDVLVVDDMDKIISFTKSQSPFIAGHDLLELSTSLSSKLRPVCSISRRNYRGIVDSEFCDYLVSIAGAVRSEIDGVSEDTNVDGLCGVLSGALLGALDIFAPIRNFVIRKPPVQWLTPELIARLHTRDQLYKRAKRANSLLGYASYRLFRNQLNADIRRAKNEFYYKSLIGIIDPAKLWRQLARLGLAKLSLTSPLHFFSSDQLNLYYASVSNAQPICLHSDLISAIASITCPSDRPEFVFSSISPRSVFELMSGRPLHSYASGSDGIPLYVLRIAWPIISPLLVSLFNRSLDTSSFPSEWKKAYIRPLSKIRAPLSPSDTRPIANLPELSKLLERIVASQILDYLNKYDILNPRQSAYRSGYNTQSALLRVCNDIKQGIDEGLITIMILFDFSKAFDTVSHLLLLIKLKQIGFSDAVLNWIFSYLTGRSQAVIDDEGNLSDWIFTSSGVPQGSVLGPLLFSLYINDIYKILRYASHMIFADDVQIYRLCSPANILQALELITCDANAIFDYANTNGLKLNATKSKVIIFGSQAYINTIDLSSLPPIIVNNTPPTICK
ncbi:uncharacterized protein [Temnothorax nylanderi]|uniref:uncharacterized protein n=1 Tax=Temnothorax nylanderi TaxID=102681 RepID=UPI003A8B134D